MVSSRELKPRLLDDIQKTHGLSIPRWLHILHNKYPLASPSLVHSSSVLYILSLITIGNVFNFGGHRIFQQKAFRTSTVGPISNGGLSLFDRSVLPDILIWLYIFHFLWSVIHLYLPSDSCSVVYFLWVSHHVDPPKPELPVNSKCMRYSQWENPL